jgi:6-pyruvoyltetrahydropterin/6-carboxytetrahydropterin synthase
MELTCEFTFEAAHLLPRVPEGHKCARLHGHSYRVDVTVDGTVDLQLGWVCDFAAVKAAWRPLHELLDHYYLNDIEGLDNPTSEVLAVWIWNKLTVELARKTDRAHVHAITVRETCTSSCTYRGPIHEAR